MNTKKVPSLVSINENDGRQSNEIRRKAPAAMTRNSIALALLSGAAFACENIYTLIRLHFDGSWGSSGTGFVDTYGFPMMVGVSSGCFSGPDFFYGNLLVNAVLWAGITASLCAWEFTTSKILGILRALWQGLAKAFALP